MKFGKFTPWNINPTCVGMNRRQDLQVRQKRPLTPHVWG